MKFEVPFDKKIYDQQNQLHFDLYWKKGFKKNLSNLYCGIIFLLLGVFVVIGGGNIGYIFIVIGLFCSYKFYEYYSYYKQNKKRFFKESEDFTREMQENNNISIWEFDEEFFRYQCYKCDFKMDWSYFEDFKEIENNLFLSLKDAGYSYILGESEVGNDNFFKILNLLESKLPKTSA